eukprot:6189475-Pleurochrysis_carterae.AAC.1
MMYKWGHPVATLLSDGGDYTSLSPNDLCKSAVGDTSTVHRYGRNATSELRVSAVRASRIRIRDRMN